MMTLKLIPEARAVKVKHPRTHPATCRCELSGNTSKPGRHPGACQCRGCLDARWSAWVDAGAKKRADSIAAVNQHQRGEISATRPVFVRAHFRKQRHYLAADPGLRAMILKGETK